MMRILQVWLARKWSQPSAETLKAYHATYSTPTGQLVLNHLLDNIYFTVYEGTDPNAALVHNSRRGVVQEILVNIDAAEHPNKYNMEEKKEEEDYAGPIAS